MLLKKINKLLGYAAGAMVFIAAFILLYDVVMRYFFNAPSLYAPYAAQFMILGMAFAGTSYALQAEGHVNVEILVDRLRPIPRKILLTVGYVLALIYTFFLMRACAEYMIRAARENWLAQGNLPFPSAILYGVMFAGSALLILTFFLKFVELWRGSKKEDE
ncbi:MAG: TRAP transporter small permease subunit [Clostridiales Family XIII bacterium]|jgi:TRAP-type C4-dicarboxylate transport system permease small subunit|nr:TRAP transporter small permease subunit [Clostridiales Family XIII bacterium]